MKPTNLLLLLIGLNFASYGMASTTSVNRNVVHRQDDLISQLLVEQVQQNISVKNSVGSLIKHYPEKIDAILKSAIDQYPTRYKEIIIGTINAQPAFSSTVVAAILQAKIATCKDVVKIAINAEPAYANEIISAAYNNSIDPLQDIVRVAVTTAPFVSNSLLSNAKNNKATSMLDVFVGIIKALPDQVVKLVKQTLKIFPENSEEVVTQAVSSSAHKFDERIVLAAVKAGVNKQVAINAAVKGGANKNKFAKL